MQARLRRRSLDDDEREDLVNLAVNGHVETPPPPSASTSTLLAQLDGPSERSLVHWLRRLVFRGAWLDQRVKEGELEVVFDEDTRPSATPSRTATTS